MLKSHSIRLAVNFCLIGALLLSHGGVAPALASACQGSASTSVKCSGCGHCNVEHEGASCGCCSKKNHQPAKLQIEAQKKSCCQKSHSTEQPSRDSHSQDVTACLCGQGSQPAVPASQTRVEIEQVLKLAPKPASFLQHPDDYKSPQIVVGRSEPLFLMPHASQRLLCIWLI